MSALPSLLNLLLVRAGPGIYPSFDYLTASFSFRKGTERRREGGRTIIARVANSLEISARNFHRRSTAGRNWLGSSFLETQRRDYVPAYRRVSDSPRPTTLPRWKNPRYFFPLSLPLSLIRPIVSDSIPYAGKSTGQDGTGRDRKIEAR